MTAASPSAGGATPWRRAGIPLALLPGALTVYFAFNTGGYFVGAQALVTILLLAILAVRAMAAEHPWQGFGRLLGVAVAALALFAVWTILSGGWSHAPARALAELQRVLPYLVALVLFGSLRPQPEQIRWMVRGVALGAVAVCATGLASRLLPGVWPIDYPSLSTRLSYPVTYWNALGMLAAIGAIMSFGLTADAREPRLVRVMAAAALPLLGSTVLLTLSRGSIAAAALGLLVFAVVGHPRALLAGLVAAAPATAIAVAATYDADLLISDNPFTRAAQDQGEHVALVVALCALGAAALRSLLLPADRVVSNLRPGSRTRRLVLAGGAVATVAVLAAVAIAVDVPRQYDRFVEGRGVSGAVDDPRLRLSSPSNGGRIPQWKVALADFRQEPIHGHGAGTYELSWLGRRTDEGSVRDAHSLYLEVMGELGLVGLVLLVGALLAILGGLAWRARGPDRALHATIFAAAIAWAAAAGIEWHWEMPVVTLWLFALGGAAIAGRRDREPPARSLGWAPRVVAAAGCCVVLVVVPLRLAISQNRLDAASADFARKPCARVDADAAASLKAVGSRPEPYELMAACRLRAGRFAEAQRSIREAIRRDPDNWRPRYVLAVIRARAGQDPRPAARAALRLDPRSSVTRAAVAAFERGRSPRAWRAAARAIQREEPFL